MKCVISEIYKAFRKDPENVLNNQSFKFHYLFDTELNNGIQDNN